LNIVICVFVYLISYQGLEKLRQYKVWS